MSDKTRIEWTSAVLADGSVSQGATWNPVTGCEKVSQGCKECYAKYKVWPRLQANPLAKAFYGRAFEDVRCHPERLLEPLQWHRPRLIFVNSLSDLFHPAIPFEFTATIVGIMAAASHHIFQILTKRPERAQAFFHWLDNHPDRKLFDCAALQAKFPGDAWQPYLLADIASRNGVDNAKVPKGMVNIKGNWPLENVWIGVSVEDQESANIRIPLLLTLPNAMPWVSAEPLLDSVDLNHLQLSHDGDEAEWLDALAADGVKWVVAGGESGPRARPMHPNWPRQIRDQCEASGVPFFFKQWGEWKPKCQMTEGEYAGLFLPPSGQKQADQPTCRVQQQAIPAGAKNDTMRDVYKVGKRTAGRALDGRVWDEFPDAVKAITGHPNQ